METEESQILRTIRSAPHDDAPRLVLADWLEENGQAERAEFIRLQCALASGVEDAPGRQAMFRRERQLWRQHGSEWQSELPGDLRGFSFHRGFVEPHDIELTPERFLSLSSQYLDAAPQWNVKLCIRARDPLPSLSRSRDLERLTGLNLHINGADPEALEEFLSSPSLRNLRALAVEGHPFDLDHLKIAVNSSALKDLRRLAVFCNHLDAAGAEIIARSQVYRNLDSLNLNGCAIGDAGLRALASSPNVLHLRELNLQQNGLNNEAASTIASSRHFKRLTTLGLFGNHLGDAGACAIANGRNLERLTQLDLGLNRIGPNGARALANSPFLPWLRELYLGGNRMTDDPVAVSALRTRFGESVTV